MEAVIRKREERVAPDPSDAPKPRTERAWTLGGDFKKAGKPRGGGDGRNKAQGRREWQEQPSFRW